MGNRSPKMSKPTHTHLIYSLLPTVTLPGVGVWGVMEQKSGLSYEAASQADLWKSEKQFKRCKLPGRWHFLHLLVENTAISWP